MRLKFSYIPDWYFHLFRRRLRMTNRRIMFLAVWMTVLCLVPALAYAGAGGSPPAPGAAAAGTAAQYCCTTWAPATIADGKNSISVLEGSGACTAVKDDDARRDSCAAGPPQA